MSSAASCTRGFHALRIVACIFAVFSLAACDGELETQRFGSLRIRSSTLGAEAVEEIRIVLTPSGSPALAPIVLAPPQPGQPLAHDVPDLEIGAYALLARAVGFEEEDVFPPVQTNVVIQGGQTTVVEIRFREDDVQHPDVKAPHIVSVSYSGTPEEERPFSYRVHADGEGVLKVVGSGDGNFFDFAEDPRLASQVNWLAPAQSTADITFTVTDEQGRSAKIHFDVSVAQATCLDDGEVSCNGTCVNLLEDSRHCGGCGQLCDGGGICVDGYCRPDPEFANWPLPPESLPDEQYEWDETEGIVYDKVTKLMWQREIENVARTLPEAESYCETLALGGFEDWRLPTRIELLSIHNADLTTNGINNNAFVAVPSVHLNYIWSSTPYAPPSIDAREFGIRVDLRNYHIHGMTQASVTSGGTLGTARTRCIRYGPGYPLHRQTPRFVHSGEAWIADTWTGLRWQKNGFPNRMTLQDAHAACASLSHDGKPARLPTKKELESLVNVHVGSAAEPSRLTSAIFGGPHATSDWSNWELWTQTRLPDPNPTSCHSEDSFEFVTVDGRSLTQRHCERDTNGVWQAQYVRCVVDPRESPEPSFLSVDYGGSPEADRLFSFRIRADGEGELTVEASGPGTFSEFAGDPRRTAQINWIAPAPGPASIRFTVTDDRNRSTTYDLDLTVDPTSACSGRQISCGGSCVDPWEDSQHCGGCGQVCESEGVCIDGFCRPDPESANWRLPPPIPPVSQYEWDVAEGIVYDKRTKLMWQREIDSQWRDLATAETYCASLNLGGYDDWRVPSLLELLSILNEDIESIPALNPIAFSTANGSTTITSSRVHGTSSNIWTMNQLNNTAGKGITHTDRTESSVLRIRCVRYGSGYPILTPDSRYETQGSTVVDNVTGLRWGTATFSGTHQAAAAWCATQTFGGSPGRMPTKKELESLIEITNGRAYPTVIDPTPPTDTHIWWTSSVLTATSCGASSFRHPVVHPDGRTHHLCPDENAYVRCVWDH